MLNSLTINDLAVAATGLATVSRPTTQVTGQAGGGAPSSSVMISSMGYLPQNFFTKRISAVASSEKQTRRSERPLLFMGIVVLKLGQQPPLAPAHDCGVRGYFAVPGFLGFTGLRRSVPEGDRPAINLCY